VAEPPSTAILKYAWRLSGICRCAGQDLANIVELDFTGGDDVQVPAAVDDMARKKS